MIKLVEITKDGEIYYAVRRTWFGMFKKYRWIGVAYNHWQRPDDSYFHHCLTASYEKAIETYKAVTGTYVPFTEVEISDLEKVLNDK